MASKSEKSFVQSSLLADPPARADGRALTDYRTISLATGVAALANGSARASVGGTDILAACKLEVEDVLDDPSSSSPDSAGDGGGGRISCSVACSPAAYPHAASPAALDDLQADLSALLDAALSHATLRPANLALLPRRKRWRASLDCLVLADAGNVCDALFVAARAALWDTRVPVTRPVEYRAPASQRPAAAAATATEAASEDDDAMGGESGFDTRHFSSTAVDFELGDYWSEGDVLDGRDRWPVCITLNLLSSRYFLDATLQEELATPLRLLLIFSCPESSSTRGATLQGSRLIGRGEVALPHLRSLIKDGEKYAKELVKALDAKLHSEEARRNNLTSIK